MRKIIHIDMDAYYAAVEQRDEPTLRGRPVVVGGSPHSRAVVCSASYEARKFGVRSAMSCARAAQLCPQAAFVVPRMAAYVAVSRQLRQIFLQCTDLVEPLSLDEAYLDVTTNLLNEPSATRIAQHCKDRIRDELQLTASAGVGPNKFIAKVASDLRKPDGLVVVPPDKVAAFVAHLEVERLWGVGPKTAKRLRSHGFATTADLRAAEVQAVTAAVGSMAAWLVELAHGRDDRPVAVHHQRKSMGAETTLATDSTDIELLARLVAELAVQVADDLQRAEAPARTVTVKLKYSDFVVCTRSRTLPRPLVDAAELTQVAVALLGTDTQVGVRPVRLVGVQVSGFAQEEPKAPPVVRGRQLLLPFD